MENQQIYKTHLATNSGDSLYYQHMQHQGNGHTLHHSYDSLDMNASESSSSSPHLSQDNRDVTLTSAAQVEVSRPSQWTNAGSGNHSQARSNLSSFDQSLQWNPQSDVGDAYQASYYTQVVNRPKAASGALHKLDSFTQVFAQQNLRIHAMSQGLAQPSLLQDAESTLRQLLSLKGTVEQQTQPTAVDRYSQVSQQMPQGLASQPQKHPHSHFYYEYFQNPSQAQSQPVMEQTHQYGQQVQSHQGLQQQQHQEVQQTHYYLQQNAAAQQRPLMQEIQQQQRPFSGQVSQYYSMQSPDMQQSMQHSHQHHLQIQQQAYNADCTSKAEHYPQDPSHGMQLIQLGSVPQYVYQNSQHQRHPYKQTPAAQQQHLQQEASPQKQYNVDSRHQVLMESPVALPGSDPLDNYNQEALAVMSNTTSLQQVLKDGNSYVLAGRGLHQSTNTVWAQLVQDGQAQAVPAENRLYPDRAESKSRLTCSVCSKEFRSLPALNGHLRSHSGTKSSAGPKQEEGEKPQPKEAEILTPIVMPVSVPVKLAPPEPCAQLSSKAEQLAGCVSDDDMPILTRMTFTPPCSPKAVSSCASSGTIRIHQQSGATLEKPDDHVKPQPERRKYRHRPEPLFIPPPSFGVNTSHSGATLYQSQLRSPRTIGETLLAIQDLPTYTPPPMLSPARQGSGLFSSVITAAHNAHLPLTPLTPTPRVLLCRSNSIDGIGSTVTPGPREHTVDVEPRINIGSRFQAEIPNLLCRPSLNKVSDKATLVWKPWPDLEREESQQQVEVFLSMSCSSVLPGGGTNLEYALHSLFEANGNILSALEMLLLKNMQRLKSHPLADYHYAGSDIWTNTEKKTFSKALNTCNKDFFHVQKMIKTKTIAQCVEYYYTWKKILRMGRRQRARLVEVHEDDTTSLEDVEDEEYLVDRKEEEMCEQVLKSPDIFHPAEVDSAATETLGPPTGAFVCEMGNCGAIFCSRQALNGHARIHGGATLPPKVYPPAASRQKPAAQPAQPGYCSVKSSPAHSTTSGETDATSVFPCKVCGKVFYKIKSRNAHMKTHRQQEEQQKQKAQKAAVAAQMADSITRTLERTTLPTDRIVAFDHFSLLKTMEEDFDDDVAQDLEDVLEETEVMRSDLFLDDEDADLLQDGADL
ncbi:transcriptional-regulating factor 1 isoform X2 [Hyperolius riggenbachi]|uniref:transcriptional-regulating factor 1 isoform X2 n=1 Tax=Hyperolius riggenbachi TaxID=752182 RepID=UPI0035A39153